MKEMRKVLVLLAATLTLFSPAWLASEEKAGDTIPAGALFSHFVARVLVNPSNGTAMAVGYFTVLERIAGPLFDGAPSEATAFFTFRSDVGPPSTILPTNIDLAVNLGSAGTYGVYFNSAPNGNWSSPDSFSSGQLIATFQRTTINTISVGPVNTNVFSSDLVSSSDFTFRGKTYNLNRIVPNGLTNYQLGSNTPAASGVADFPLAFAFAGSAVAVGGKLSDLEPRTK
jgi:hypothetical protein